MREALRNLSKSEEIYLFEEGEEINEKIEDELIYSLNQNTTGKDIYRIIGKISSGFIGRGKITSELLNKFGIEGIRYNGEEDGECAVVFDDKAINTLNKYYQSPSQQPKGQITLSNTKALITLFETADKSTFLHETGHYFLKLTEIMAKSGSRLAQSEIAEIRKFTGNKGGSFNVEQNELFARSFEAYLRRGIAPNSKLKEIFEKFKEWLMDVYESISELNVNLSPDVVDFFDSYITADVDVNAKANNERLQRINDVNDKVKEIKNTLYQNKDITEAEVEDEIMKRLKNDVEMVEKLKSELPKDIQEDIVKNDYLKMDRVQFLENKIENIKSKGTKEYKKKLIEIICGGHLPERFYFLLIYKNIILN